MRFTYPGDETPPCARPDLDAMMDWLGDLLEYHEQRLDVDQVGDPPREQGTAHVQHVDHLTRLIHALPNAYFPDQGQPVASESREALLADLEALQRRLDRLNFSGNVL